jgi:hypothetical protein
MNISPFPPTLGALPPGLSTGLVNFKPAARPAFSEELRRLGKQFNAQPATLAAILSAAKERGIELVLVLVCLPFLTPIPLPGLSTPLGLVVCLIGARFALGRKPWLPRRLLDRELPRQFITTLLAATPRIVRWLEYLLRPRLGFLHEQLNYRRVAGTLIMFSGLMLMLPLPIPLTNCLPALTVVLLAAGTMEHDGVFCLAGCMVFAVAAAYFGALVFGGADAVDYLRHGLFAG